jgi:hypothetical protein
MQPQTLSGDNMSADNNDNKAISTFEKFFYRYLAWFPILILPMLVVEMFSAGQHVSSALIALMHAVLVFRFFQVVKPNEWFAKKKST